MAIIDMGLKWGGVLCPFRGALGTRLIQCGLRQGLRPYQVASSSIQPFGHNSVGCHSLRRNISTNYCFVVETHTVTVRSDDARYLPKIQLTAYFKATKLFYKFYHYSCPHSPSKFLLHVLSQNATYLRNSVSATNVREDYFCNL